MAALPECLTRSKETRGLEQSEQRAELRGKEAGKERDLGSGAAPGSLCRRISPADLCSKATIWPHFETRWETKRGLAGVLLPYSGVLLMPKEESRVSGEWWQFWIYPVGGPAGLPDVGLGT